MGAVAAVEVAIGFFFSLVASGLNVLVSARCARVGELNGQYRAIAVKPVANIAARSFEPCRTISIECAAQVSGNRAGEDI